MLGYNAQRQRSSYVVTPPGQSTPSVSMHFQYREGELGQAVVTGTQTYTDTYLYTPDGLPLELLRQQGETTSRYWYVLDGQNNVVALTDVNGNVVDRYGYDLWGAPTSASESVVQPFRYAGYWYDRELGWYWLELRSYDPALERFLQPDPTQAGGVRDYVYADDDPLDGTDPTGFGLCEVPLLGGVVCTTGNVLHGAWQFVAGDDLQTLSSNAGIGAKAFAVVDLASNATLLIPFVGEGVEGAKLGLKGLYFVGRKVLTGELTREEVTAALKRGYSVVTTAVAESCVRCFPARTQVATPRGTRTIEHIKVGDTVLAEDPTRRIVEPEPVQRVIKDPTSPLIAVQLSDGSAITVTADHPFWINFGSGQGLGIGGWIAAGQLHAGDHLRTASGADMIVTAVRQHVGQAVVYTLTVAKDHTFFVGTARVLVHNTSGTVCNKAVRGLWQITRDLVDKQFTVGGHTYLRDAKTGLWWSSDTAGHGGSAWKVFEQRGKVLHWIADADEYGDFITGKHKGPIGLTVKIP